MEVHREPNPRFAEHVAEAIRVLQLPTEVSGLHYHPFGVYSVPLAKRTDEEGTWSRRLHLWHPEATPVGEASPYGVHTHSGPARSHVLYGSLYHHLYQFEADAAGVWQRACLGEPEGRATLLDHVFAETRTGQTHSFPANHAHGVTKPDGWSISLFSQLDGPTTQEFTTWQRTDVSAEPLLRKGPVPVTEVARDALLCLEGNAPRQQ
ncbi:MAG: hypothetical protein ACPHK8_00395 [Thermoplasmatota archaeon]